VKLFKQKPKWYVNGLAFECIECGKCCAGPEEGYVWITDSEITALAESLGLSEDETRAKYIRKIGRRQSLVEQKESNDCVFLTVDGVHGKGCSIYQARPVQCRTWPFWRSNLTTPADWSIAGMRCAGINRGKLFSQEEIESRANGTRE